MDTTQSTDPKKKGVENDETGDDGPGKKSANTPKPKPYCKFQIEKSNRIGLLLPANLELAIKPVVSGDNDNDDAGNQKNPANPVYYTDKMYWTDVTTCLPPAFRLYAASGDGVVVAGAKPVADFCPRGWQGVTSMTGNLEVALESETTKEGGEKAKEIRKKWAISRVDRYGWSRQHSMTEETSSTTSTSSQEASSSSAAAAANAAPQFIWKGSKKSLEFLNDGSGQRHTGNLKFETKDGLLLAVWKQSRYSSVLGSVTIFESAVDLLPVETIVASCISVVMAERVTGMNWLGGLGK